MRVITGSARGRKLKTLEGDSVRPTTDKVKESIFNIIQFEIPTARVLDLFGGTGQLGIEALSRGAGEAVFVDQREDACKLIHENLRKTGLTSKGSIIRSDYADYLKKCNNQFNIIILDPPYADKLLENSLKIITEIDILQSGGIIVAERPVEKVLEVDFDGYSRSKDYKYGKTVLTLFRKV